MLTGAHSILYSKKPEADRAFLRDVLGLPHVDVGEGWLIFGLPPAEVAVHPSEKNDVHEFYLMCDDVAALAGQLAARGIACAPVRDLGWGVLTQVTLPGGGKLGIYEPRHARPKAMAAGRRAAAPQGRSRKQTRPAGRAAGKAPAGRGPAKRAAKAATRTPTQARAGRRTRARAGRA
jgi:hypothetical protein